MTNTENQTSGMGTFDPVECKNEMFNYKIKALEENLLYIRDKKQEGCINDASRVICSDLTRISEYIKSEHKELKAIFYDYVGDEYYDCMDQWNIGHPGNIKKDSIEKTILYTIKFINDIETTDEYRKFLTSRKGIDTLKNLLNKIIELFHLPSHWKLETTAEKIASQKQSFRLFDRHIKNPYETSEEKIVTTSPR